LPRWPLSIGSGRKMLAEMVAASSEVPPGQRIFARSLPRFDTTISRPGPLFPGDARPVPQALVSYLEHLEVERIVCDSFRRPADNLPRQYWPPCQSCPKSNGPARSSGSLASGLTFALGSRETTEPVAPAPRSLIALHSTARAEIPPPNRPEDNRSPVDNPGFPLGVAFRPTANLRFA
jgi:hypothetical protein